MPFSSSIRKDLMENLLVFEYKFKKKSFISVFGNMLHNKECFMEEVPNKY